MKKSQVYTKTGDKGKTSLVGGMRVNKSHIRLEAYGTADELNSFIGFLDCEIKENDTKKFISFLQHKLFTIGSHLATETEIMEVKEASIINKKDIERIEEQIDIIDNNLPKINRFILPGGNESSSRAHICRTISRRLERIVYKIAEEYPVSTNVVIFINRLSDYFFVLARKEATNIGKEIFWEQCDI